jgi:transcriptional regulator CBF1
MVDLRCQLVAQGDGKDSADAAHTLSNLSQANFSSSHQLPQHTHLTHAQTQGNPFPHGEPGPSSHPRGPPNLGDLSALASQSQPIPATRAQPLMQDMDDGASDDSHEMKEPKASPPATTTGKRGGRSATMGSEEWTRQRKDNHVSLLELLS